MNEKIKFGILSLCVIIFQSVLKLIGVIITGSLSFLSETVDTIIDIVFVSITLYTLSQSQKPPDYEHMYGHLKIDSIGAMIQGIILINLYILLIFIAVQAIVTESYTVANPDIGLLILIISFSVNLIFSRILIREGKRRKSPSLEIQGFNLFQDSIRAIVILISFTFALFGIIFLDPFFSIALSVWIIIGAFFLAKNGVRDLIDTNPINKLIIEEIRANIFNLEHVNGVEDIKIRTSGDMLFLETHLSVEDHISLIHAYEITKSIRAMGKKLFPFYEVETLVEMNPLGGEKSVGKNILNLIYSMKTEYPEIIDVKDLNIFRIEDKYCLSLIIVIDETLSLKKAHDICTNFEDELKKQASNLSRIITHIEGQREMTLLSQDQIECLSIDSETMKQIKQHVENILRSHPQVKGYHGFEFWTALNYCILEMHIFFDGDLNISIVHQYIEELEYKILDRLKIDNLQEIILHSEPLEGRIDGIIFDSEIL